MIHTEDLSKQFDTFLAVDGVSIDVPTGQVLALLGPNGAGKTTTVRMLTSVLVPSRGRALVAGYDVVREATQVRACVGVLTEQHGLYGRMNAVEYLQFFADLYRLPQALANKRINALLEQFGLNNLGKRRLGEFSKGMRQKLALVRTLLHDPQVLLLDEPTSAMDPESARMVRDAILTLRSNERTIILCTHNLAEAEELADQIAIIRRGRIIQNGSAESLKTALLGMPEYEVKLAASVRGLDFPLPDGVVLTSAGENWLRFQVKNPDQINPVLLSVLLEHHLPVVSFQALPHSLEQAYLVAVNQTTL